MQTAGTYIERAREAAEQAAHETDMETRGALLDIAEAWLALAEAVLRDDVEPTPPD